MSIQRCAPCLSALCIAIGLVAAPRVCADLLAYEGFDYAVDSSLVGQTGGTGFATAWGSSTGTGIIQAPGMAYPFLSSSGGRLSMTGTSSGNFACYRDLSVAQGADGTTVWISFLGQTTTTPSANFGPESAPSRLRPINFSLYNAGSERLALGEGTRNSGASLPDTDVWGLVERGGVNNAGTRWTTASLTDPSFVLVRIDYGIADVDTAFMWINPTLDAEPLTSTAAATTTFTDMSFNRIRPFAGNPNAQSENVGASGYLDEIRIGTTWSDVTTVPEPGVAALAGLGLLAIAFARRGGRA